MMYKIEVKPKYGEEYISTVLVANTKEEAVDRYIEFMGDLYTREEIEENFYISEYDMDEIIRI